MATLTEAIEATKADLLAAAPRIVQLQAQTQLALVTLRIQSQGLGAYHYSPSLVPTYFFAKKVLNAGGRAYIKKNRLGNWGGLRAAQGLPVDGVYLTYTGQMFRSLTSIYGGFSGTVYVGQVEASNQEEAAKVGYNMTRYGDFLAPTPSERDDIETAGARELQQIIQRNFPQS